MLSQSSTFGKIIPLVDDSRFNDSCLGATCSLRQLIIGNGNMGLGVANQFSPNQLEDIRLYLISVRDASVGGGAPAFSATGVGATSTATVSVQIANSRGTPLNYVVDVSSVVPNEFKLTAVAASPAGCNAGSVPATGTENPSVCTINATVSFEPTAVGTRSATLNVALTAPSPADPQPLDGQGNHIALTAEGVTPLTVSATALTFNTNVNVPLTRLVNLANVGGSNINITGLVFNAAATAANYTLAANSGCTVGLALVANGPSCNVSVVFSPTAPVASTPGATLTIEYNGLGSPKVVTLSGSATVDPRAIVELTPPFLPAIESAIGFAGTPQTITVHNSGNSPLQFTSFSLGGPAATEYERTGTCGTGTPMPVGPPTDSATNCTIVLTFRPTAVGVRAATLTILSSAANSPTTIALSGNGVLEPAPQVSLAPSGPLAFGSQTAGGLYPARIVVLTNAGNAPMAITGLGIEGTGFANVSAQACPATLAVGTSCTINIRFTPTVADADFVGVLRITSNAPGSPHTVALTGHSTGAVVPVLAWSPAVTSLDFGLVSAGTASAVQSLTLRNAGPGGVQLLVVNAIGTDASAFTVNTVNCTAGTPLYQDAPCRVDIAFAPGSAGPKTASIQVVSSGSAPATLTLSGTGLGNPNAGLATSATTLNFDSTRVGAQSVPIELTLSGTGAGSVNVVGLSVTGPYLLQSKTCATVPFSLPAGSSCTMTVTFQPQSEGGATGVLRVTTDATPALREVALSGNGAEKADVSGGGGCSMASGHTLADPTLWVLAALAWVALLYRRRARSAPGLSKP